jgi:hypothetical protein
MRSKTPFLIALILASTLLFGAVSVMIPSHAASSSGASGYSLSSVQSYDAYGQFLVNETLHGANNSTSLSSVTFGFPVSYQTHLVSLSSYAKIGSGNIQTTTSTSVSNNTLFITVNLGQSVGGANSTVGLGFWVLEAITNVNSSGYFNAPVLYSPSVNIQLNSMYSEVNFPYSTTDVGNITSMGSRGYAETISGSNLQIFNFTTSSPNSTLKAFNTIIYSSHTSSGLLDFTSIVRQISIDASGQILVKDTLNIRNLGLNTISALSYSPLTTVENLTALPSNEPPLSNVGVVQISGGQLQLNSTNQEIQPESSATLIFQYPLPDQYWKVTNGIYTVTVPTTVPITGVIDQYTIHSTSVPGVVIIGQPLSLTAYGTTQIGAGSATLKFRVGIASATSDVLPVAGILFVGVFAAALLFRPKTEVVEDVGSTFDNLIKAVEDKLSSTNEILSELKSKGSSVGKNELVVAKSRIEDVRTKAISRISSVRSQMPQSITTSVQAGLNTVMANDREFDRVVRDILNNYDQVISKRMKVDTFTRVQQNNERRLQNYTNALLDSAHDLREEFESEK